MDIGQAFGFGDIGSKLLLTAFVILGVSGGFGLVNILSDEVGKIVFIMRAGISLALGMGLVGGLLKIWS